MWFYRRSCGAVILAILAGCGSSDSNDGGDSTAVSPSPPPIEAPDPAAPPAGPTPVPPPPVMQPLPDAPPPDVPPPTEAKPAVSGDVLIGALSWRYSNDTTGFVPGTLIGEPRVTGAYVEQRATREPPDSLPPEGSYFFGSAAYMNRDPFTPPRYVLRSATVSGHWAMAGSGGETSFTIGEQVAGNNQLMSVQLLKPGGLVVLALQTYELDQTLAQWSTVQDTTTWEAAVQIQSDDVAALFRMCWQMKFPAVDRISCGLFDRQSGLFSGVHISDNFEGQGPLIWRSVRQPNGEFR